MIPIKARSRSEYGMLITRAGRTFWVIPKSTCHTSPRSGTPSALLLIKTAERSRRESREIVVCKIIRHRDAFDNRAAEVPTLSFRELLELAQDMSNRLCHR